MKPQLFAKRSFSILSYYLWKIKIFFNLFLHNPCFNYIEFFKHANEKNIRSYFLNIYGKIFLEDILASCRACNLKAFIAFGTLIGYYSRNNFLPNDDDIDFGLLESEQGKIKLLKKEMIRKGYSIRLNNQHFISFNDKYFPGLFVDFFYFVKKGKMIFCSEPLKNDNTQMICYYTPQEVFAPLKKTQFMGLSVLVPNDVEGFLIANYGKLTFPPEKKDFDKLSDYPNSRLENSK